MRKGVSFARFMKRMKTKTTARKIPVAAIGASAFLAVALTFGTAVFSVARAANTPIVDKCEAIYEKYPLHTTCPHANPTCIAENQRNREARMAAGCKPERDYER